MSDYFTYLLVTYYLLTYIHIQHFLSFFMAIPIPGLIPGFVFHNPEIPGLEKGSGIASQHSRQGVQYQISSNHFCVFNSRPRSARGHLWGVAPPVRVFAVLPSRKNCRFFISNGAFCALFSQLDWYEKSHRSIKIVGVNASTENNAFPLSSSYCRHSQFKLLC